VKRSEVPRILASGGITHAVLVGSLVLRDRGVLSHDALLAINVVNGLWPLAFGTMGARRAANPIPATVSRAS
jgi:hypothetical protein